MVEIPAASAGSGLAKNSSEFEKFDCQRGECESQGMASAVHRHGGGLNASGIAHSAAPVFLAITVQ
jgi:hypothetical protein